jgi:hypothetical protein
VKRTSRPRSSDQRPYTERLSPEEQAEVENGLASLLLGALEEGPVRKEDLPELCDSLARIALYLVLGHFRPDLVKERRPPDETSPKLVM